MTNMTNTIYGIVHSHSGIKCVNIANMTHKPFNSVSGILSMLKRRGSVYNKNGKWYAENSVNAIKQVLIDIHESLNIPLGEWAEGYISALANYNIINENDFDGLIEYIKLGK